MLHVEYKRGKEAEVYAVAREVLRTEMHARLAQYIADFGAVVQETTGKYADLTNK
ncbi:hypothetical protein D3C73_1665630 [compost metagenome]